MTQIEMFQGILRSILEHWTTFRQFSKLDWTHHVERFQWYQGSHFHFDQEQKLLKGISLVMWYCPDQALDWSSHTKFQKLGDVKLCLPLVSFVALSLGQ